MNGGKVRQYPDFVRLFHTSRPLRSVELRMKKESRDLVASTGHLCNFDDSTIRTTNWSCLPLPPSSCAPRSANASPAPVTYQNGACFKKYNYHLFSFFSDKTTSLRSWVYTFMYSCDSSCQLKRHVSSQFTSSLFPLHLRHLLNCSSQMHLQIENLIITVPFLRTIYFSHGSTCFCCSLC